MNKLDTANFNERMNLLGLLIENENYNAGMQRKHVLCTINVVN